MLRVSLIICTYNRADILSRCLVAAREQTLSGSDYEIIVVDNASTDHTRAVVERFVSTAGKGAEVRYLFESAKGLSHARNAGAEAARSPTVTYIDDDAIAAPDLLERIDQVFKAHPDAGAVGGRIDLRLPGQLPWWYSDYFDGYYSKFDLKVVEVTRASEVWQYPFGANISLSRVALESVGGFNIRMGRIGRDCSGGEEIDACCRIAHAGYGIYYTPFASVEHVVFPSRLYWDHIAKTARAAGRNWAYYEFEVLKSGQELRPDILAFLSTCKQMVIRGAQRSFKDFCISYSQCLFYRAKIIRKLRYRWA
ncbi:MAG TPA: glycosyltransferase [Bryobacteraceae bacterium]|nr:glycosyltransferase [Bryobacteraceae bacterium]